MTEEDKKWEEYLIPGTDGVLKNKFGISDNEELKIKESEIVFKKLVELYEEPINGNFDKNIYVIFINICLKKFIHLLDNIEQFLWEKAICMLLQ